MARLLKKYATPYFEKLLVVGNKTLQGKRDMCIHHILGKFMNHNFAFYQAQANELDAQYVENVCTVLEQGMDYTWRHGAAYIQVLSPLGNNHKRENLQQVRGGAKKYYIKARHQVEVLHRGVLVNIGQLPHQGSSVVETRKKINSWAASHEEKWRCLPTKPKEKV